MGAKIFISYAREDAVRVKRCQQKLRDAGYATWMDKINLHAGQDWEKEIKDSLKSSDVVIFFISRNTNRNDRYFQRELIYVLEIKKEYGIKPVVVPACLDDCSVPAGLEQFQKINIFKKGGWERLLEDIKKVTTEPHKKIFRSNSLKIGANNLKLPCFFPAISSTAKSTLTVLDHLRLLVKFEQPNFLISAFDIHELREKSQKDSRAVMDLIYTAHGRKNIILLDSGNYEKYWRKLDGWPRKKYIEVLGYLPTEFVFCYDNLKPSSDHDEIVLEVENSVRRDEKATDLKNIIPIVHSKDLIHTPHICQEVVSRLNPLLIAVPERELGEGIFKRAETVTKIRKAMDETKCYYPLHILGTGNPLSILLFVACGADSFDGLEWCQTSVDKETGRLYHSQLADFFLYQSPFGLDSDVGFAARTLLHNLLFYKDWMNIIQESIGQKELHKLLMKYIPPRAFDELIERFPEVQEV